MTQSTVAGPVAGVPSKARRIGMMVVRAALLGLFAFLIFGPLLNLVLWAFAERWYFPNKLPSQYGFTSGPACSIREAMRWRRY